MRTFREVWGRENFTCRYALKVFTRCGSEEALRLATEDELEFGLTVNRVIWTEAVSAGLP
jgi:hypothetical protein